MKIKDIPFFTQPYHRLKKNGVSALSDAELLAIIISSGSRGESAVDTANRLLKRYNFNKLPDLSLTELKKELGNEVKALRILSLIEINRRNNKLSRGGFTNTIESAQDVFNLFVDELKDKKNEHFIAVFLDSKNKIIKDEVISVGTLNSSLVHPREVFKEAIKHSANSIILIHNHPSGDVEPSEEDKEITEKLQGASDLVGIRLLDHIIVGKDSFYSFKQKKIGQVAIKSLAHQLIPGSSSHSQ